MPFTVEKRHFVEVSSFEDCRHPVIIQQYNRGGAIYFKSNNFTRTVTEDEKNDGRND